jgi:putative inorganic carbon (HCO3(-)) transporter
MIQDFPFTGLGMGSFTQVADILYPFFLYSPGSIEHAHNLFLQIAIDLGVPGLIAWSATLVIIIFLALKIYRYGLKHGDALVTGLGAAFISCQIALTIHGLTDAVTWGMVRPAPIIWLLWGAVAASNRVFLATD